MAALGEFRELSADLPATLKRAGFGDRGDRRRATASTRTTVRDSGGIDEGSMPVYKRIDTCAAEFESFTPYMYSTYEQVLRSRTRRRRRRS